MSAKPPAGWSAAYQSDASVANAEATDALMPVPNRARGEVTESVVWKIRNISTNVRINGPTFGIRKRQLQVVFNTSGADTSWISFADVPAPKPAKADHATCINPFEADDGADSKAVVEPAFEFDELTVELSYPGAASRSVVSVSSAFQDRKIQLQTIHFGAVKFTAVEISLVVVRYGVNGSKFNDDGLRQLSLDIERQLLRMNKLSSSSEKPGTVRLVSAVDESVVFVVPSFLLCARSPVLRGILEDKSFRPASDIPVAADGKTLTALVGYIHTGKISPTRIWTADESLALFEIAQFYEMDHLASVAVAIVADLLQPQSALAAMRSALRHGQFVDDDDADDADDADGADRKDEKSDGKKKDDLPAKPAKSDPHRDLLLSAAQFLVRFAAISEKKSSKSATAADSDSKSAAAKPVSAAAKPVPTATIDAAARLVEPWNGRDGRNGGLLGRAVVAYAAANLPAVVTALLADSADDR